MNRTWSLVGCAGIALALVGAFVLDGAAGSIVLAVGLLAIFGAAIRFITRGGTGGPDERRVPAGHSGV